MSAARRLGAIGELIVVRSWVAIGCLTLLAMPAAAETRDSAPSIRVAGNAASAPTHRSTPRPPPFPATLADKRAAQDAASKPDIGWPAADVTAARVRCTEILNRIHAVAIPQAPLRQGACGTPAPIQLISIGRDPQVTVSPPATITCELADKLALWLEQDLQPLAHKHLGSKIVSIENMSSYSCRNVYGNKKGRLSQHGMANALDIRAFVTAHGKRANVLADWGVTARDIRARIAAQKAAEEKKREAEIKAAAAAAAAASRKQAERNAETNAGTTTNGDGLQLPRFRIVLPSPMSGDDTAATLSFGEPNKLGGPRLEAPQLPVEPAAATKKKLVISVIPGPATIPPRGPKSAFLKAAHKSACRIFGTTLGPELNEAHRNHFHIDMAPRNIRNICD